MSCAGCGNKYADQELHSTKLKAFTDAKKENAPMAIYKDDEGRWTYGRADIIIPTARPIVDIISKYSRITA